MGARRIVVRILGVASTTRGFAFALTEGPRRLVVWGQRRVTLGAAKTARAIGVVLRRGRPLFVAFERQSAEKKRHRGRLFSQLLSRSCDEHGVMLLDVDRRRVERLSSVRRPTKWDIGHALAGLFPECARRLPPRRKAWQSEDDRIGLFMALAAAVGAWESFRSPLA